MITPPCREIARFFLSNSVRKCENECCFDAEIGFGVTKTPLKISKL